MRPCILAIFVVLCAQNYLKMHTLLVPSYNVKVWPNSADKNPTHAFSRLQGVSWNSYDQEIKMINSHLIQTTGKITTKSRFLQDFKKVCILNFCVCHLYLLLLFLFL